MRDAGGINQNYPRWLIMTVGMDNGLFYPEGKTILLFIEGGVETVPSQRGRTYSNS